MKRLNLKVGMNIHDDNGIDKNYEDRDMFNKFCEYMGLSPDKTNIIPFNSCGDSKYAYALEGKTKNNNVF